MYGQPYAYFTVVTRSVEQVFDMLREAELVKVPMSSFFSKCLRIPLRLRIGSK